MKNRLFCFLVFCIAIIFFGCSKNNTSSSDLKNKKQGVTVGETELSASNNPAGATQISGLGAYAAVGDCANLYPTATYVLKLTGDLDGCVFVFVENYGCSPSGTYREDGREYFVGYYKGALGSFETSYKFEAKYDGCALSGLPLGLEIFGRCQHPIVKGTGGGSLTGVTGRLDYIDDIETGNFPYRGHLRF